MTQKLYTFSVINTKGAEDPTLDAYVEEELRTDAGLLEWAPGYEIRRVSVVQDNVGSTAIVVYEVWGEYLPDDQQ